MSRNRIRILAVAVAVRAAAAAVGSASAGEAMTATVFTAERSCRPEQWPVAGILTPASTVEVRADAEGLHVAHILVEPGDSVRAGQVLARLSDPDDTATHNVAVRAPADGIVTSAPTAVGGSASPGAAEPLFRITLNGALVLQGEVTAVALPHLRPGQPAALQIAGSRPVEGTVESVGLALDPATQLGTVRIAVAADPTLPGLSARGDISGDETCAVTVPLGALIYEAGVPMVRRIREDRVETRPVTLGRSIDDRVEITEGVWPGDVLVRSAAGLLRNGNAVRPLSGEP